MTAAERQAQPDLLDLIDAVVWEADPRTRLNTFISGKIESLLGYSAAEWTGTPGFWEDHLHPDDRERVTREGEAVLVHGVPYELEYRMVARDGRVLWFRDRITPVLQDGELVKLGGVMIDDSHRRHAEARIRELQERLEKVFHASPLGILVETLTDGRIIDVNRALLRVLGYERADIVEYSSEQLNLWVDRAVQGDVVARVTTGVPTQDVEVQLRAKDGAAVDLLLSCERIVLNGEACLLSMLQDNRERKRAEAALQASQARLRDSEAVFRALFEHSPDAVVLIDPHSADVPWKIIACNDVLCSMNGYPRDELVGASVHVLRSAPFESDEDGVAEQARYLNQLREHGEARFESLHQRKDGTLYPVEISATVVQAGGRELVLGIDRDITARKRGEAALEHSEARFRSLVQNASDIIAVQDRKGTLQYTSPAVTTVLGYLPEELHGRNVIEYVHDDDRDIIVQAYANVVRGGPGATAKHTHRYRAADGQWRWLEWAATNRLDDPNVLGIVMNSRDVTERKTAEESLERSEARFRSFVQNGSDIITLLDGWGAILYESPSVTPLLGYAPADLLGRNVLELVHDADATTASEVFVAVLQGGPGATARATYRFRTVDGQWRWLDSIFTNRVHDPAVRGIVVNSRDVTQQKEVDHEVELLQERFSKMFQASPVGMTLAALASARVIDANDAWLTITGLSRDDVIGASYRQLDVWVNVEDRARVLREVQAHGSARDFETKLRHVSGEVRDVLLAVELVEVAGEQCTLVLTQDITHRKLAEAALAVSQQQLRASEKLAGLGRLTAGLAHEINTPLAATMNSLHEAQVLTEEYRESIGNSGVTDEDHRQIAAELRGALDEAQKTAGRIGEFIRRMRSHTRNTVSGEEEFDAARLTGDTLAMLAHQARAAKVQWHLTTEDGLTLRGEPGRFTQVVANLAQNAIHACADGQGSSVTLRLSRAGAAVLLEVEDDGSGIAPDVLPRIFEPLFTTKAVGQGTGLGLSIIHDIVTGHFRGDIAVRSEVGRGTVFTVSFPT